MKEFDKSSKLEHVAYDIRGPVLDEAMRMRANGEKILRLNTGNPAEFGFTAPDEVIHDLIMNARDSEGYSDSKGIFSARKAIMQYCQLKNFPNVDIDDIYLGNGVSELIVHVHAGLAGLMGTRCWCQCQTTHSGRLQSVWLVGMLFTMFVMSRQNGIQILTILSQKSHLIPRLSLSLTLTIQRERFILRNCCWRLWKLLAKIISLSLRMNL